MTATTTDLVLSDLIWEDGTVRAIDTAFPADLSSPDGQYFATKAKIVLVQAPPDGTSYAIAAWTEGAPPTLYLLARVSSIRELSRRHRRLVLDSGIELNYLSSSGCGCGSTLRSFRPWSPEGRMVGAPRPVLG